MDLQDFTGNIVYAKYSSYQFGDEELFYKLILGDYEGTAGESLSRHNYMSFSTRDEDHDTDGELSCAVLTTGAWWYQHCLDSNLNGLYIVPYEVNNKGMTWFKWENNWKTLGEI